MGNRAAAVVIRSLKSAEFSRNKDDWTSYLHYKHNPCSPCEQQSCWDIKVCLPKLLQSKRCEAGRHKTLPKHQECLTLLSITESLVWDSFLISGAKINGKFSLNVMLEM